MPFGYDKRDFPDLIADLAPPKPIPYGKLMGYCQTCGAEYRINLFEPGYWLGCHACREKAKQPQAPTPSAPS